MAKKLTEPTIERLSRRDRDYVVWDAVAVGLGVKITPRGRRSWVLQSVYPGQATQARRVIGQFPGMGLAEARQKAARWRGLIGQGIDPAEAEAEEREQQQAERRRRAARRANTFRAVAERYVQEQIAGNRRAAVDAREIERMLIPAWGDRPIHEILPRDVRELFGRLKAKPYDASNGWRHASGIFTFAVFHELIEVSPMASLRKRMVFAGVSLAPRQRVLSDAEICALLRAVDRLGPSVASAYRLLLFTGARLGEVRGMRWSEVDLTKRLWTVPPERFKSNATHLVPLSDAAIAALEAMPTGSEFVFSLDGERPVWIGDKIKKQIDARMLRTLKAAARREGRHPDQVELPNWTNHDLRRTLRTGLAALGVDDVVAELTLGHARTGLQRVYDVHRYEPQIRVALQRWADRIREIVGEPSAPATDNVVAIAAGKPTGRARR